MNDIKHVAVLFQSTKSSILLGVGLTNWVYTSTSNLTPHAEGTFGTAAPLFSFFTRSQHILVHPMDWEVSNSALSLRLKTLILTYTQFFLHYLGGAENLTEAK